MWHQELCVCVLVTYSCPSLCNSMDCSLLPGSSVHEFSRQEYWSGLPFPSAGDLPDPGIKPWSPALQADSLPSELQECPLAPRDELLVKKISSQLFPSLQLLLITMTIIIRWQHRCTLVLSKNIYYTSPLCWVFVIVC